MKKIHAVTLIAAAALILASCGKSSSVDKAITQVEASLDKFEANTATVDKQTWEVFLKEIEKPKAVIDAASKGGKLSEDEKLRIQKVGERIMTFLSGQVAGQTQEVEQVEDSTATEVLID